MAFDLDIGQQIDHFLLALPTMSAVALLVTGAAAGVVCSALWFKREIALYKADLAYADKVIAGKLPLDTYKPRIMRKGARMVIGLVILCFGLLIAIIGAGLLIANLQTKPVVSAATVPSVSPPAAPIQSPAVIASPSPSQSTSPVTPLDVEAQQRSSLLKRRGDMELAVRDAGGTPARIEFAPQAGAALKLKDGETEFEIQTSIAHALAVWLNPSTDTTKNLRISKSPRGTPVDIRRLRPSRGSDTISIGDRAFFELANGKTVQLLLVGVLWYRAGDDIDEARFKYKVYNAGEFLIDPL